MSEKYSMPRISPIAVRYIKLGEGGMWERDCIERDNTIRLGYESPFHRSSLEGDWDVVRRHWLSVRKGNEGAATRDLNQIRDFYELGEDALWITFYRRKLYWAFAEREVIEAEDGSRIRRIRGQWRSTDINGNPLFVDELDGRLTKVQGYRGTICSVDREDYLIRKVNGEVPPEVQHAQIQLAELKAAIRPLLQSLWWKDFELLADLIFTQSGWQRTSVLGKTEKSIDLELLSPVTGRKAFVQVKSQAGRAALEESIASFRQMPQFHEMYFVVHTCGDDIERYQPESDNIHVLAADRLADLIINAGLVRWLIQKSS